VVWGIERISGPYQTPLLEAIELDTASYRWDAVRWSVGKLPVLWISVRIGDVFWIGIGTTGLSRQQADYVRVLPMLPFSGDGSTAVFHQWHRIGGLDGFTSSELRTYQHICALSIHLTVSSRLLTSSLANGFNRF